jgi:hypothetical protein
MEESWDDRLGPPGINWIETSARLSFKARFVAAPREREGQEP